MPLPKPESACFLIADLSGYTDFLNGVELDHAQDRPDGITHVEFRVAKPKPKDRAFLEEVKPVLGEIYTAGFARLRKLIEGREISPVVVEEPALLPMRERFLTQPVMHRHETEGVVSGRS